MRSRVRVLAVLKSRTPEQACPYCGVLCDEAACLQGMHKPKPGALTMCLECAGVSQFGPNLELVRFDVTGLELVDPEAARIFARSRRIIKERAPS